MKDVHLRAALDAVLALRLANEQAGSLTPWQRNANAKADAVLQVLGGRDRQTRREET